MNVHDAQASLDDIRRLQDRTRAEYVRDGFSLLGLMIMAVALILVFSWFDLPRPWDVAAVLLGDAVILGAIAVGRRRMRAPAGGPAASR